MIFFIPYINTRLNTAQLGMEEELIIQISLILIGLIGAVDEYVFHYKKLDLAKEEDCFKENILHTLRQFIFSAIFISAAYIKTTGAYSFYLIIILILDILIGFADVIIEPKARKNHGGLAGGEYFLHMLLSFSLGIFHFNYIKLLLEKSSHATTLTFGHTANSSLESTLAIMAFASLIIAFRGLYHLINKKSL